MNTRIDYIYRDADNYKTHNTAVVAGAITEEQITQVMNSLDSSIWFIPSDVGLDGARFETETDRDHPWFELCGIDLTLKPVTTDITIDKLVKNFTDHAGKWRDNLCT